MTNPISEIPHLRQEEVPKLPQIGRNSTKIRRINIGSLIQEKETALNNVRASLAQEYSVQINETKFTQNKVLVQNEPPIHSIRKAAKFFHYAGGLLDIIEATKAITNIAIITTGPLGPAAMGITGLILEKIADKSEKRKHQLNSQPIKKKMAA